MRSKNSPRLLCEELSRRTGYSVAWLGGHEYELCTPRPLKFRIVNPPHRPGQPIERAAENILRRAGELGWHPRLR